MTVPFLDLGRVHHDLRDELTAAIDRVVTSGRYVLGPEVEAFEREFAGYCGARHCVGVGNGMQAIELVLRALDIGPGDEVVTVAHTAFPTAAAISAVGATPVFVDVDGSSYCMDPGTLGASFGPRTRAVVAVHLYGRCADMTAIRSAAAEAGVPVLEDAAQAHGATHRGRRAGTLGDAAAFSFYPTKNLGALGDGGAVVTDDDELAEKVRRLRNYGESEKNVNVVPGYNSRLDELQAAILRAKLRHLDDWNAERRRIASMYHELLAGSLVTRPEPDDGHVYHLYVVTSPDRDELRVHLRDAGVESQVHYPTPVHLQPAYRGGARVAASLEVSERLAREVLSLPAHPGLADDQIEAVAEAVQRFATG